MASEIDLQWTYVGGPRGLIDAILADDRIEALPADTDDAVTRVEDWVTGWAAQLADGLMVRGAAALSTPRGSVHAWLRRPTRVHKGELRIESAGRGGTGGIRPVLRGDDENLRGDVQDYLTAAPLDLAAM